ncbi:hypothetical protein JW948_16900 [bacterium]|nr:hypothetical protein [bacterium]
MAGIASFILAVHGPLQAQTTDDVVFIHHSCGANWLSNYLNSALLAKDYIDERNDIYYGTTMSPDAGRPASLGSVPGDNTNMNHWIRWFNDYLDGIKAYGCADGENKIIMFKSCYPISNIYSDGTEPADPFSSSQTLVNYKAVYRHPSGPGNTYSDGGYTYKPLEDIFPENPNTLFIAVTAPPRNYAPSDATNDAEAHRARLFNNWLKTEWLDAYNAANPGLDNVAVFDWFDVLAYADDHSTHPNRLRQEYGGESGDSHPSSTANAASTVIFADSDNSFIDLAWEDFITPSVFTQVKIFLEAAYDADGDTMRTELNDNTLIPLKSPYADSMEVTSIPAGVTDWIYVHLRDAVDGDTVSQRSFFIRSDGWISDTDGTTKDLEFEGASAGTYFISVSHRNHLSVISNNGVFIE